MAATDLETGGLPVGRQVLRGLTSSVAAEGCVVSFVVKSSLFVFPFTVPNG